MLRILLVLAAISALNPAAHATTLAAGRDEYVLTPALEMLCDETRALDISAAATAIRAGRFEPLPRTGSSLGYRRGQCWFHIRISNRNHAETLWVMSVPQARLDRIEAYVLGVHDEVLSRTSLGDHVPFAQRSFALRYPNLAFELPPGASRELVFAVETTSSMQFPLEVRSQRALLEHVDDAQLLMGLYYGILLGLSLYNLVIWLSTREQTYLSYVVYVFNFGLLMFCLNGYAFEYFWPAWPRWANDCVPLLVSFTLAAATWFARLFLDWARYLPRMDRVARWFARAMVVFGVASFGLEGRPVLQFLSVLVLVHAPINLGCAAFCLRRGHRPAFFFLASWGFLILGTVLLALSTMGWIASSPLTEHGMQIGSAAEMVLLSFALAYRLNLLREENVALEHASRVNLERRVDERTAALNDALRELTHAHHLLNEYSRRDGLTHAYNRRHLDELIESVWHDFRQSARPLALLMIDLDHFKRINDTLGHATGDDCLVEVAALLESIVTASQAAFGRYGGEEFVVLQDGADDDSVAALAERIRAGVAALSVAGPEGPVPLTVSIGHALAHADDGHWDRTLERADAALYAAKQQGRNRVVAAPSSSPRENGGEVAMIASHRLARE
ncbi:MAG: diguanylate cyclase [Lysobacterales bacterium]